MPLRPRSRAGPGIVVPSSNPEPAPSSTSTPRKRLLQALAGQRHAMALIYNIDLTPQHLVANQGQQVPVLLDQECLVPALEKVPDPVVPAVESLRIGRLQCQHDARQPRRTPLDRQVDMVAHQAEGQEPEAEPLPVLRQPIQICPAVFVIAKHGLPLVPANDDLSLI